MLSLKSTQSTDTYQAVITDLMQKHQRGESTPMDLRDAAFLALRFEAALPRAALREMPINAFDETDRKLNVDGYDAIGLSISAKAAIGAWVRQIKKTTGDGAESLLLRHVQGGVEITNTALTAQHIHYLLNKHKLHAQERAIVERPKARSVLAKMAVRCALPELGYTPINLRALRERYGLSHQDVADILGVSHRAAQSWELESEEKTGKRDMSVQLWTRLVEALYEREIPAKS